MLASGRERYGFQAGFRKIWSTIKGKRTCGQKIGWLVF